MSRGEQIFLGLLVAGMLIAVLEDRLFGPPMGIAFPDARPEVTVCSDGVVVRNMMTAFAAGKRDWAGEKPVTKIGGTGGISL